MYSCIASQWEYEKTCIGMQLLHADCIYYVYDNFTNYNAVVYAVNCIGYIASYGAWALLCLHYATTLLQNFSAWMFYHTHVFH